MRFASYVILSLHIFQMLFADVELVTRKRFEYNIDPRLFSRCEDTYFCNLL